MTFWPDILATVACIGAVGGAAAGVFHDWPASAAFWAGAFVLKTAEALILRRSLKRNRRQT